MKNRRNRLPPFLLLIILIGGFLLFRNGADQSLKQNGIIIPGRTLEWGAISKGYVLNYEFRYQGKLITGGKPIEKIRGLKIFEGRIFPVTYDPKFGISQILIDPAVFKRYQVNFPDSLNWVLPYFE